MRPVPARYRRTLGWYVVHTVTLAVLVLFTIAVVQIAERLQGAGS